MKRAQSQNGFVHALALTVVVLVLIAAAGWLVYDHQKKQDKLSSAGSSATPGVVSSQATTASNVSTAPTINSTSDLDNALKVLNQNDPDSANASDTSQLSGQANF